MKIIFLDIDGVLNCESAYRKGHCQYFVFGDGENDFYQTFDPDCKKWLNHAIEQTGAKVVISSSWRGSGIEWMRKIWELEDMSGEIIDLTPHLYSMDGKMSIPRGLEIKTWLGEKGFHLCSWDEERQEKYIKDSGIENYVIIDDDSDMLYNQRNNFVHVLPSPRNKDGFTEKHAEQTIKILDGNFKIG